MSTSNPKIIPALYINITEKCNMRCEYCAEFGENFEATDKMLDINRLFEFFHVAKRIGITGYRITGGEPMLYPERVFSIISKLNEIGITDIILNTNGIKLNEYIEELAKLKINKIKISLDSLNREKFNQITGVDKLDEILKSIEALKSKNIPFELNMVVFKKNSTDFWELLSFCIKEDISLKILDLIHYENLVRKTNSTKTYWENEFFRLENYLEELTNKFGSPEIVRLSNNRGIPMYKFKIGKTSSLTIKDSTLGSTFAFLCRDCGNFPCQEGLFHLSLSASGNLTPCRMRRDLITDIGNRSISDYEEILIQSFSAYQDPFFLKETIYYPL